MVQKNRARVLIVDDEPMNLKLLAAHLKPAGYELLMAKSGAEALDLARRAHPDIILLDIMMPDINGYEVTRRLKADRNTRSIPIVLITALHAVEDKVKGLKAGADDFLSKPVDSNELLARVRSLTRMKLLEDELALQKRSSSYLVPALTAEKKKLILLIESDDSEAERWEKGLTEAGMVTVHAESGRRGMDLVAVTSPDLIVLDLMLPDMRGVDLLRQLKKQEISKNIPVVTVATPGKTASKAQVLESGADDCLNKPVDARELQACIAAALRRSNQQRWLQSKLHDMFVRSITDPLTGLYNRQYLYQNLIQRLNYARRYNHPFSLLMLDLDLFKQVNDRFGHLVGDDVLKQFAAILNKNIRSVDIAARYGGEEFVVVVPETRLQGAVALAEKLRRNVAAHTFPYLEDRPLTVSIGVTEYHSDDLEPNDIIKRADQALYAAKHGGRDRISVLPGANKPQALSGAK